MQIGVTGVFAQYYRDQIVENTRMGQRQAAERGRWQNHAPRLRHAQRSTGAQRDGPDRPAHLLAASQGLSYLQIETEVGVKYSTVRFICLNRAYLGEVKYSGEWFAGSHAPWSMSSSSTSPSAVTPRVNDAARTCSRARCAVGSAVVWPACTTTTATRPSTAVAIAALGATNPVGLPMAFTAPRVGHEGPRERSRLTSAIRHQLTTHKRAETPKGPSVTKVIESLQKKERKLLDLYYADQIDSETFGTEHRDLVTKLKTLQKEREDVEREQKIRNEAVDKFDDIAELLSNMEH